MTFRGLSNPWTAFSVLLLAALAAYQHVYSAPFVFDDQAAIVDNPTLRSPFILGAALRPPAYASGASGRPLVNLTLALNYAAGGLDVRGYHAVNLGLHILASLVLFGLVRRTLEKIGGGGVVDSFWTALAAALVWSVHPLLSESVACVIQRTEVLAGLFYLLTLYCFARGTEPRAARAWLTLCVLSCFLGVASKEILVSAPIVVLFYDRTFVSGTLRAAWSDRRRLYIALAFTWLPLRWFMLSSEHRGGSVGFGLGVSGWDYLLTQCRGIGIYLKLSIWPHPLSIDYGTDIVRHASEVIPQGVALLLMAAVTAVGVWRRSMVGFLGLCFFVILAPSSSVVPLVTQPIAEHRMYLPLAAIVLLAVVGGHAWAGQKSLLIWPAVALGLGWVTHRRIDDYRTQISLIQSTLAVNPQNDRAYLNLGTFASRQGRLAEAIADYQEALTIDPAVADTHNNLGAVLEQSGQPDEAIAQYREAARLQPDQPAAYYNLGLALLKTGRMEEAIGPLTKALQLQPDSAAARRSLGLAHRDLGILLAEGGRLTEAKLHFTEALRLTPDDAQMRRNLERIEALEAK